MLRCGLQLPFCLFNLPPLLACKPLGHLLMPVGLLVIEGRQLRLARLNLGELTLEFFSLGHQQLQLLYLRVPLLQQNLKLRRVLCNRGSLGLSCCLRIPCLLPELHDLCFLLNQSQPQTRELLLSSCPLLNGLVGHPPLHRQVGVSHLFRSLGLLQQGLLPRLVQLRALLCRGAELVELADLFTARRFKVPDALNLVVDQTLQLHGLCLCVDCPLLVRLRCARVLPGRLSSIAVPSKFLLRLRSR
mmetsp:Transcript_92262/g.214328  ORF Transcript_92262/g.214328 Transcript_92262/m.214328 type:complete len:245 (-) Transcript_92262:509-1243(-)